MFSKNTVDIGVYSASLPFPNKAVPIMNTSDDSEFGVADWLAGVR